MYYRKDGKYFQLEESNTRPYDSTGGKHIRSFESYVFRSLFIILYFVIKYLQKKNTGKMFNAHIKKDFGFAGWAGKATPFN